VGDPGRLGQIIINLVGNAVKFTEQGEVVVRVEAESTTQDAVSLHFAVRDTGIGIPREKQELIFAAFAQADGSMSRKCGGTGLGLTISSQLVGMMGGRLWVASEVGKGSTFRFTARFGLPVGQAPRSKLPAEPVNLRGIPVLVVDDNSSSRHILEEMLIDWGMKPSLADGGRAALAEMQRAKEAGEPFPLVLTDAQMPDMDGFTLAEWIRQDPALAGAAIMMLASAGQRGDAARCRELGVIAYLNKPVKQSDLLDAFLATFRTRTGEAAPPMLVTRHWLRESRPHLHILLAEDNPFNQQLSSRLLAKWGHSVVAANNGKEALAALAEAKFDLVLMDVQMPDMNGFEATAAIRKKERASGAHIPIVAMTADAIEGDRDRCLAAGMDGYASKPIQAKELIETIESLLPASVDVQSAALAEQL
jgi:two-component system sensor histidine kinase/response regulator